MKKIMRELGQLAARYGFEPPEMTKGTHLRFRHTVTGHVVHSGSTPSDVNVVRALAAELRKIAMGRVPTDPAKAYRNRGRGARGDER